MAEGSFSFERFIEDSKKTLINPKEYFSTMAKEGGYGEPVIKALLYGLAAGILSFIWYVIGISGAGGLAAGAGVISIVVSLIAALIGLFIGGIIILIISAICWGNTNFEANVRVSASLMVLSPVSAFLSVTGAIAFSLGIIISLIVWLYGIWLLYIAETEALGGKRGTAKIVSIILVVVAGIMTISAFTATRISKPVIESENLMEGLRESEDVPEEVKEMLERAREEAERTR